MRNRNRNKNLNARANWTNPGICFGSVITLAFAGIFLPVLTSQQSSAAMLKEAKVTRVVNDVDLIESDNQRRDARANDIMSDDMVLATGNKSRAELRFADDTLARVGANSFFTFTEGTRNMELGKGTMLLKVPKGAGGAKISTQSVTAAITGTTVMLETNPGGQVVMKSGEPIPTPEADEDLRRKGMGQYLTASSVHPASHPLSEPETFWAGDVKPDGKNVKVAGVSGSVRIMRPGSLESVPLKSGDTVPVGSFILTQSDGNATLNPVAGVATRIAPGTTVKVTKLNVHTNAKPEVEYDLKEGSVLSALGTADHSKIDYKIRTPNGIVAARGTVIGTQTQNHQTGVFGGHGTITFLYDNKTESIVPGEFKNFIGSRGQVQLGSNLPANSPEFQQMMQQTLLLVQQAAEHGLVRPGLPGDVQKALRNAGIQPPKVTPAGGKPKSAEPAKPAEEPNPQSVAKNKKRTGGLQIQEKPGRKGFSKMIVLEGTMRIYLNDRLGESMLIKPGQMIILNPNARRLPIPVNVNIKRLAATSRLVNGFDQPNSKQQTQETPSPSPSRVILSDTKVAKTIRNQRQLIQKNILQPTQLKVIKNRIVSQSYTPTSTGGGNPIATRNNVINASSPTYFQRPVIHPGSFNITNNTRIQGAPPTANVNGTIVQGSIYRPANGSFAQFAFADGLKPIDIAISDPNGGGPPAGPLDFITSIYKFENLTISGDPQITQGSVSTLFGTIAPENLALIGYNDVLLNGGNFPGNDQGLSAPTETLIASENGAISINNSFFDNFNNSLIFYGRRGSIDITSSTFGSAGGMDDLSFAATGQLMADSASSFKVVNSLDFISSGSQVTIDSMIQSKQLSLDALTTVDLSNATITTDSLDVRSRTLTLPTASTIKSNGDSLSFSFNDLNGNISPFQLDNTNFDIGPAGSIKQLNANVSGVDLAFANNFTLNNTLADASLSVSAGQNLSDSGNTHTVTGNPNASVSLEGKTIQLANTGVTASSSSGSNLLMRSTNGTVVDASTLQATTTTDGPAQITLENTLSNDINVKDGSSITATTTGNSSNTITTVRLSNDGGKVIVGNLGGSGASIKAQDGGTNLNNRPTIFINASGGVQINNSSQLQAILQASANGSGLIEIKNDANGDVLIANNASITAGDGLSSNTTSQVTLDNTVGNVEIGSVAGGATITANRITAKALGTTGKVKIYAGSVLTGNQQVRLFSGSAAGNAVEFAGSGNVNISSPDVVMRANTVTVSNATTVNVGTSTTGDVLRIFADSRNFNSSQTSGTYGDINLNGTTVSNALNYPGTTPVTTGSYQVGTYADGSAFTP